MLYKIKIYLKDTRADYSLSIAVKSRKTLLYGLAGHVPSRKLKKNGVKGSIGLTQGALK